MKRKKKFTRVSKNEKEDKNKRKGMLKCGAGVGKKIKKKKIKKGCK